MFLPTRRARARIPLARRFEHRIRDFEECVSRETHCLMSVRMRAHKMKCNFPKLETDHDEESREGAAFPVLTGNGETGVDNGSRCGLMRNRPIDVTITSSRRQSR